MVSKFNGGCFVDSNGYVRDVVEPGFGMTCKVEGKTVFLLGPFDADDGAEVLEECTFYPSLAALAEVGVRPDECGKAILF
ncbi:TPA: hypothetical protein I8273_004806 [Aeromonas hydrophila]|nr:hypothetical protein [Aeromonas hydrophila]HAT2639253.1 hypothetical protein [Aeromonas hydrophila]HAT3424502.1 hypothetical protein [Aeromonas hydrophila]HAT3534428.1 hypothetical protein [Aeromonas hydrophila]